MIIRKRAIRKLLFELLYLSERTKSKESSQSDVFKRGFNDGQVFAYRSLVENLDWDCYYDNFKYRRKDK